MSDETKSEPRTNPALPIYRDRCRHFTGIQHVTCAAGVKYHDVRAQDDKPFPHPCLDVGKRDVMPDTCLKRSFLTQDEHAEREREIAAAVERVCAAHASGKCHICGASIEPSKQVGRCLYASCGHRIGQTAEGVQSDGR